MAACLPLFTNGFVALVGNFPGGVGNNFSGPNTGTYHNNGYDGLGTCTGDFSTANASTTIYIGNTSAWSSVTKTGLITAVGLGDGATVTLTISNTIIKDLGPGTWPVSVRLSHGGFSTDSGSTPTPGSGTLSITCAAFAQITSPISFPNGQVNVTYPANQQLLAVGGSAPYTYVISSGGLPPGLTLSSGGLVSGTPTTPGVYLFGITVSDSTGNVCPGTNAAFAITIPSTSHASAVDLPIAASGGQSCNNQLPTSPDSGA